MWLHVLICIMKRTFDEFTKIGFAKLLRPFEGSTDDIVKLTRAFGLAIKAHSGQYRNGTKMEPYINHPLRVGLILTDEMKIYDIELICAALLHDIFEKGNNEVVGENELKEGFGENVYNIIKVVTKPTRTDFENDKSKVMDNYFDKIARSPKLVRYIKLADRLDNVRSLKSTVQREKMVRYKEETQKYVVPIAEQTDERIVFKLSVALYELK
jgi:(p)ppGpp synthase/HD superfamily hydrolase